MALFTLRFNNYDQAKAAATALGFWDVVSDTLNTRGNSVDANGNTYGWQIIEIGQDPVITPATELTPAVHANGYFVNVTGQLPPQAAAYAVPYGSAGWCFAGTEPAQ